MTRILLIDADMVAYRVAIAEETGVDFGGTFVLHADADNGKANVDAMVQGWMDRLGADEVYMAFSDSRNFRKEVMPTYKSNRADVRRPMILGELREHITETYQTQVVPGLEADDVLGIVATSPKMLKEYDEKVVVTWDKDLRTVPGLHWNPTKDWRDTEKVDRDGNAEREPVVVHVTPEEADLAFYAQVLSGDPVDGYPGCPNVGAVRARRIVEEGIFTFPEEHVLKSGPNKGDTRVRWMTEERPEDPWACIVSHYEKAGMSEEDALQSARVARILRVEDFNFKTKEPILWNP